MIYVDDRAGSCELAEPLSKRGLTTELTRLDFGDVAFVGRGANGSLPWVGVEFKKLREFIASVRSERLQGYQLPGMRDTYGPYCYVLVEGEIIVDKKTGLLLEWNKHEHKNVPIPGRMTITELRKRRNVLNMCGGLNSLWSETRQETLEELEALYRVWTDVPLDQHTSHIGMYQAPPLVPISPFRQAVCKWPNVGIRLSRVVEQRFGGSILRAASASLRDWEELETTSDSGRTRRLGEKAAAEIVQFLRGTL